MAVQSSQGETRLDLSQRSPHEPGAFAWLEDDWRPLDWNGPAYRLFRRFRPQELQRPIIEHFERTAHRYRERIALREGDTTLTFGELWDGASGLAERLAAETTTGDLIGILMPACPMFPLVMLACFAAGRPFVVLDTRYPAEWLDQVLRDARPAALVTLADGLGETEGRTPAAQIIRLTGLPEAARQGWRPTAMGVDEPACVLFSSGSTGRPKSIVNSQRNLLQRAAQSINAAHINSADRLLTLSSASTIVGVRDVITALLAGASIHLLDPQGVGAREILRAIRAEAITILFAFPALLRSIVAARETRADSLRLVRIGGDTTLWSDIATLREWLSPHAAVQIIYAATEAPMMQWFVDDSCRRTDARVPIGYPLPGNRLAIVDEDGRATAHGEVGELVVGSPYVSLGRWGDGRFSNESVEAGGGCGWRIFRTGDLVRQRVDGLLERVGRKDRQVKIRGSRVDLDGVEAMLRAHPAVRDVAAVARPGSADGALTLVAYVSGRVEAPAKLADELKALMRSAAPAMRPARFYVVPSIPRLPSSKLDVRALAVLDEAHVERERVEPAAGTGPFDSTADYISETVARVWQEVLLVPVRAADDDFFDSGGDSLKAITFALELERALEVDIPLILINEAPRFDRLCEALRERRAPGSTSLVTLKAGDGRPPVFFIHGIGGNVLEILPTARRVAYPGAVIGIRARGIVQGEAPHTSIEAMAGDYLQQIKERQPNGPYQLCGYSSGGLVAFEIARRLSESGDEVSLLGLFDTTMSPLRWPLRAWFSIAGRRVGLAIAALRETPIRSWLAQSRVLAERLRAGRRALGTEPSLAIRVIGRALVASAMYRPGFYREHLTLFSPATREPGLPPLESVWRKHARSVAVVQTPGTHSTMLSGPNAEATAACLTRCLRM